MTARTYLVLLVIVTVGLASVCSAQEILPRDNGIFNYHRPPNYRESESHPLRIAAYVTHPAGWILRESVFRPLSAAISSTRFTRSFFGYRAPFDHREPYCFSPSDEVPNCWEMPPMDSLEMPADVAGAGDIGALAAMGERQVFLPDVAFDFSKSTLNDLGRGRVRQIAQLLASVPSLNVVVSGHTDYVGSDEYNQKLGLKRADNVISELAELGIDPARMSPVSQGEAQPIFTEEEDWARAVNRRVQFSVSAEAAN